MPIDAELIQRGADALSEGEWTWNGQPVDREEIARYVLRGALVQEEV